MDFCDWFRVRGWCFWLRVICWFCAFGRFMVYSGFRRHLRVWVCFDLCGAGDLLLGYGATCGMMEFWSSWLCCVMRLWAVVALHFLDWLLVVVTWVWVCDL